MPRKMARWAETRRRFVGSKITLGISIGQHESVWRGVFLSFVVSVVIAELTSAIGLMLLGRPIYWTGEKQSRSPTETPLRSEKDPWGAWGIPNSTSHLVGECFNVEYKFNSVGARDKERQIGSPNRWIVLGDSMIEAYGIEQDERLTNILEESLGLQFANFGSSGDFGPLQYLLVYRHLAKQFEHQGVMVGLTLFNDFTDNDSDWWKLDRNLQNQNRYRPYWVLSTDNRSYRIIYGVNGDATPRGNFNVAPFMPAPPADEGQKSTIRLLARGLSEVSSTFSLLRHLSSERSLDRALHSWGYFSDDQREITAVKLALDDLSREIGARPKIILLLRMHSDLVERRRRGTNYGDQVNRFLGELHSDGWTIIDTAEAISEADRSSDITLGCDIHWNSMTNRRVAEFILLHYREYLTGASAQPIQ
jgi:hypothetical protein